MKKNDSKGQPSKTFFPTKAEASVSTANKSMIKWCAVCGRKIEWRRKWRNNWGQIKYCSKKCRRSPLKSIDRELENAILNLLRSKGGDAGLRLNEAALRQLTEDKTEARTRLFSRAINAARRLAGRSQIVFVQNGRRVDASRAKSPVLLKIRQRNEKVREVSD